jgi:phosphinothricin acetyltransferase
MLARNGLQPEDETVNRTTRGGTNRPARGSLEVRIPVIEDFPAMLAIANWAIRHTIANFRCEPEPLDHLVERWSDSGEFLPWFVAARDGAVIGFAHASSFRGCCDLAYTAEVSVYVDPDHQRTGVARALYEHLIPTLAAQGYRSVVAAIAVPNPASERLHRAFGFREVGRLDKVGWKFDSWHDVASWQLVLKEDDRAPAAIKTVSQALLLAPD